MELIVYTQPECRYSQELKKWLHDHKVPFTEKDITKDHDAWDELARMNVKWTPVTVMGDTRVNGFNIEEIRKLVGKGIK
jgi:glutaredoxin